MLHDTKARGMPSHLSDLDCNLVAVGVSIAGVTTTRLLLFLCHKDVIMRMLQVHNGH